MIGAVSASQAKQACAGEPEAPRGVNSGPPWWSRPAQRAAADADLAHWIRYADALALEGLHSDSITSLFTLSMPSGVGDPEGQRKLHPRFGEFDEDAVWRLGLEGPRRGCGDIDRQLADQTRIGVVGWCRN